MKRDPYNHKQRFEKWIAVAKNSYEIDGMNKLHSELFISFIKDLRIGLNVSTCSKKGERSFIRLNTLRGKLAFIFRQLENRGIRDVRKVTAKDIHHLFSDMRSGQLATKFGTPYKSTGDYIKEFKTFWHWYQKIKKKDNVLVDDITEDLDTRGEKPKFVYFTENDFENILTKASYDLKPIIALAFDSGTRVTELLNVKVSDFSYDFKELNIRDENSKTFGRKIKLMICQDQIKNYVKQTGLKNDDYVCRLKLIKINAELRQLAKHHFSSEQIKFKNLTLKDFRHSSACFWLPRYKSESAMKYRFGWKKSDMIHYYTEFLGMKDTITQDDMYLNISKTELEKEVDRLKNDIKLLKESVGQLVSIAKMRKVI